MKDLIPLSEILIKTNLSSLSHSDLKELHELLSSRMELITSADCKDLQNRVQIIQTINNITEKIINHLDTAKL